MKLLSNLDLNEKSFVHPRTLSIQSSKELTTTYDLNSNKSIDLSFTETDRVPKANGDFDEDETFDHVDVKKILKRLIYGYTPPRLSLTSKAGGTHEIGSLTSDTITVNVTKGSRDLSALTCNPTDLGFTLKEGSQSKVVDFSSISSITCKSYNVSLSDKKNPPTNLNASVNYSFQWRVYAGISDTLLASAISIPDNTNSRFENVQAKGQFAFTINTSATQYYWFAIPSEWKANPSVKDPNNFELKSSLGTVDVSVTNGYKKTAMYKLYYSLKPSQNTNFRITVNC